MRYRTLGRTNLRVSLLGLGGGGRSRLGRAYEASPPDVHRLVRRAMELGINVFDTAADYGTEELLAPPLSEVPRDSFVLSTKFGPTSRESGLKPAAALRESLEGSLRALGVGYVDVLFLHGVRADHYTSIAERFLPELRAVQQAGLARFVGVSESWGLDHQHEMLAHAIPSGEWDVVMPGYNMLSPLVGSRVLPLAEEHNVGTMIMCAVRSVFSDSARVSAQLAEWRDQGLLAESAPRDLAWVSDDLVSAAYRFAAEPAGVSTVLSGTGSIAHLEDNVRAIDAGPLPREVSDRLCELFLPVARNVGHGMRG